MSGQNDHPPPSRPERHWPWARSGTARAHLPRISHRSPPTEASEQERLIIERLADLRDMEVREVMTPRVDVVALSIPVTADAVISAVRESGHSCFPVVADDLDDLVGVLFVNDLFRATPRRSADLTERSALEISRRIRQPHVVPETRRVLDVLSEMRHQRRAFAVVVDEYGGVAGVLTVKDLIEPLVGELHDEFDENEGADIVRVDVNRWLIDGRTSIDEVHDRLGLGLPEGEYVTIAGYLFDAFGHIPVEGERLSVEGWELRVVELERRRIAKVLAHHGSLGLDGSNDVERDRSRPSPDGSSFERPAHGDPEQDSEPLGHARLG